MLILFTLRYGFGRVKISDFVDFKGFLIKNDTGIVVALIIVEKLV